MAAMEFLRFAYQRDADAGELELPMAAGGLELPMAVVAEASAPAIRQSMAFVPLRIPTSLLRGGGTRPRKSFFEKYAFDSLDRRIFLKTVSDDAAHAVGDE